MAMLTNCMECVKEKELVQRDQEKDKQKRLGTTKACAIVQCN